MLPEELIGRIFTSRKLLDLFKPMTRFDVITGGKPAVEENPEPQSRLWHCPVCKNKHNITTSACIEVFYPEIKGRKINKGRRHLICLLCHERGETTRAR